MNLKNTYSTEKKIDSFLRKEFKSLGFEYLKNNPATCGVGFPDRTVINTNGGVIFLELKSKGAKRTEAQLWWAKRLKSMNQRYILIDEIDEQYLVKILSKII